MAEVGGSAGVSKDLLDLVGLDENDVKVEGGDEDVLSGDENLSEGSEEEQHTELKFHERGWVQAGSMGVVVGFVTIVAGFFLSSSFGIGRQEDVVAASQEQSQSSAAERGFLDMTPEQKDARISELEAQRAILDQRYRAELAKLQAEQQLNREVQPDDQTPLEERKGQPRSGQPSTVLSTLPDSPTPLEPVVVPPPSPPPSSSPSPPVPPSPSLPAQGPALELSQQSPEAAINQWQVMWQFQQKLGSFGRVDGNATPVVKAELSTQSDPSSATSATPVQEPSMEEQGGTGQFVMPEENLSPYHENQDIQGFQAPNKNKNIQGSQGSISSFSPSTLASVARSESLSARADVSRLPDISQRVRAQQEAFLQGYIYPELVSEPEVKLAATHTQKVMGGTQVPGRVKTPVIFLEGDERNKERTFSIEIVEESSLTEVLPPGTLVLGRVSTVAPNGLMFLEGTAIVTPNGIEYKLPENAVEIRGEKGRPLMAKLFQTGTLSEIAKLLGTVIANGVQQVARLYNEPEVDRQVIVNSDSENIRETVITKSKNTKNYRAAAIEGALSVLNPKLQEWLQSKKAAPVNVWHLEAGRKVDIFFHRTVQLNSF
ncbi:hypothetical protein [Gloeomargarita sp.]